MARSYYTLCIFDRHHSCWYDAFGSYSLSEVRAELQDELHHYPKSHLCIIRHDGSAAAMIAARDALPRPSGARHD